MLSCTRCGKPGHHSLKCRFKDANCHHCGKVGHKTSLSGTKRHTDKTVRIKGKNDSTMQESTEQHSVEEYNPIDMKSADERNPYTETLEVNGKPLVMEFDTGASYSVSDCGHKSS